MRIRERCALGLAWGFGMGIPVSIVSLVVALGYALKGSVGCAG